MLLKQNRKMKASSSEKITVMNWSIPAFMSGSGVKTCPNAGECAKFCYARKGFYHMSTVKTAHNANLEQAQSPYFASNMIAEITFLMARMKSSELKIRIHDNGDFFSEDYWDKWNLIMHHFANDSRVSFYAYTKQVQFFKEQVNVPKNMTVIFSLGGKQDHLIDQESDRHSKVFKTEAELIAAGYVDSSHDDMVAANSPNNKIGLVLH